VNATRSHPDRLENVIVILGPTAVGKSAVAVEVARRMNGEVISADSRAFFRGLDIVTDKPSPSEQKGIIHHLIDVVEFDGRYDVMAFRRDAERLIREIRERGRIPIIVGGGTLYFGAILRGLFDGPKGDRMVRRTLLKRPLSELYQELTEVDPMAAAKIHQNDRIRVVRALEVYELTGRAISEWQQEARPLPYRFHIFGLRKEATAHRQAIKERCERMIERGLVNEIRQLRANGLSPHMQAYRTIGVPEVFAYLDGKIEEEELKQQLFCHTWQLARHQMAWFMRDEGVEWIDVTHMDYVELAKEIVSQLSRDGEGSLT
jgi:tRNA dimethylallyltransferase